MVRLVPPRLARLMTLALQARGPPEALGPAALAPAAPQLAPRPWQPGRVGSALGAVGTEAQDVDVDVARSQPEGTAETVVEEAEPQQPAKAKAVTIGRLLGGPEEERAVELLRGALRISDPGLSEAQAADVVAAQWPRLPLGERAGYVAKTLTNQNQTSQWGGAAWAELTPEEKNARVQLALEKRDEASEAAQLIAEKMRAGIDEDDAAKPRVGAKKIDRSGMLLGGPKEEKALELLRAEIRSSSPEVSEAEAATMIDSRWPRLSNGEKAAFVAETLGKARLKETVAYAKITDPSLAEPEAAAPRTGPLIGGPADERAVELIRGALRRSDPGLTEAEAARMLEARWTRLPPGLRAAYVATMLSDRTSERGSVVWSELTQEERSSRVQRVLEQKDEVTEAVELMAEKIRSGTDQDRDLIEPTVQAKTTQAQARVSEKSGEDTRSTRAAVVEAAPPATSSAASVPGRVARHSVKDKSGEGEKLVAEDVDPMAPATSPEESFGERSNEGTSSTRRAAVETEPKRHARPASQATGGERPREAARKGRDEDEQLRLRTAEEKVAFQLLKQAMRKLNPDLTAGQLSTEAMAMWGQLTDKVRGSYLSKARKIAYGPTDMFIGGGMRNP